MKIIAARIFLLSLFLGGLLPVYGQDSLVTIPTTSREIVDGRTGIPIRVTVDSFRMATTEITQGEFETIMGRNPSTYQGASRPVENVSWWEAIEYCNRLSEREGLEPCYNLETGVCDFSKNGYRLPTDAEWTAASGNIAQSVGLENIREYGNLGSVNTKDLDRLLTAVKAEGTTDTASYLPNEYGLYDMLGNVWEWCYDYYDPVADHPTSVANPHGPPMGLARIIRGGSHITTVSEWNLGYRSSIKPEYKSRFTGFRIARSLSVSQDTLTQEPDSSWFDPYNQPPADYAHVIGYLSSLIIGSADTVISSVQDWSVRRTEIREKWEKILSSPDIDPPDPNVVSERTIQGDNYTGELLFLQVEPDFWEKIYIMRPTHPVRTPVPAVIVPYYDVDVPTGKNLGGRIYRPMGVRSFAYHMVQQGYIAVAVRWFGESYGESYDEAVANMRLRHPDVTGLGKWVWDVRRLVDYLHTLPDVDHDKIGIIGHSLGGKMALYAAAFDSRIQCAVASEPGIGFQFSNYDDYWYFGEFLNGLPSALNQHELLGLIAPRPFLLIGGDTYDTDESWYYINAAREVYSLYDVPHHIGYYNHHSGHAPTPEAVRLAINWIRHFLD